MCKQKQGKLSESVKVWAYSIERK